MSKRRREEDTQVIDLCSETEDEPPRKRMSASKRVEGLEGSNEVSDAERSDGSLLAESDTPPTSVEEDSLEKNTTLRKHRQAKRRVHSYVAVPGPAYPRSSYQGWEPPITPVAEYEAIDDLRAADDELRSNAVETADYTYFELNDFNIYRPKSASSVFDTHTRELVTLDRVLNRRGNASLLLEGVLSSGGVKRYVRGVAFSTLTIDGYGEPDVCDMRDKICIQSDRASGTDIWYRLGTPASEYQRFYTPFLWLAGFAKHFADYLLETENVTLEHFRSRFHHWLSDRYSNSAEFRSWMAEASLQDFRTTVVANVGFLLKECHGIDDKEAGLCEHPIWGEVNRDNLTAIPSQPNHERRTVVTPFTYDCFKHMYFAKHMCARPIMNSTVEEQVRHRKLQLRLTPLGARDTHGPGAKAPESLPTENGTEPPDVQQGDVVCLKPDENSPWRTKATVWYAYVQAARARKSGSKVMDVLWLYEAEDTTLGAAYYPFKHELFLSDNCSCGDDAVSVDHVIRKVDVAWSAQDPAAASGFFVRQRFSTRHDLDAYNFSALTASDFECRCALQSSAFDECISTYKANDTVLVLEKGSDSRKARLEPAQIISFDRTNKLLQLRRLLRKAVTRTSARPNELVLTDVVLHVAPEQIVRKCNVRFLDTEDVRNGRIPTPYNRDGAGDYYFCTSKLSNSAAAVGVEYAGRVRGLDDRTPETTVNLPLPSEGWNPQAKIERRKLTGMGIFCGGGNFDRGLEEGGAVEFKYAVDWAERALHSYRANAENPEDMHFFLGSVNDYLALAIAGSADARIARSGAIDVLSAGSPCPGFSVLQQYKQSEQSLANASMVASVVSFVDFYSPQYCILENVVSMTSGMGVKKDENVFAQILAAFVAMGYQVQQFLIDAWSVGSSQSRSRVFIVASAPGLEPLPVPPHTHAHPEDVRFIQRRLGRSSNGLPFGVRRNEHTPFPHLSAREAVADLTDISDSQVQLCPTFPDHKTPAEASGTVRTRMAIVPILPQGMGIIQAYNAGLLSGEPLEYVKGLGPVRAHPRSTTYSRVYPDSLFPTIITTLRLADGITGRCMHWEQHRSNTVMEVRRAQGFPDYEVIMGLPAEQVVIVGNSVDRKVSLALGLSLRQSWNGSFQQEVGELRSEHDDAQSHSASFSDGSPEANRQDWVEQSRSGTLRLSNSEVEEVRAGGGFKAIIRILCIREGGEISGIPSRTTA
ncbi:hypothetical protein LTR36_008714 [Oleoguttula mirabilis]|uniref:DNA (cytosine-5-)-methyltransferase n=1 Tax=Oleoguttula mirabilis TaxID=1507867 RepID=A0AAV9JTC4_9PEZI|nr:hypothetical protein LTR36_008714 [Oleoguttula mirabilis]